jgi:hypothetical protein
MVRRGYAETRVDNAGEARIMDEATTLPKQMLEQVTRTAEAAESILHLLEAEFKQIRMCLNELKNDMRELRHGRR